MLIVLLLRTLSKKDHRFVGLCLLVAAVLSIISPHVDMLSS
jgi:hypothetical protein